MTFNEWKTEHTAKVSNIVQEHSSIPIGELINKFSYNSMINEYPDFCPLYKTNTRCHNMDDLNCFNCGCPFFEYSDTKPLGMTFSGDTIMSRCTINSKQASTYTNNNVVQCDCSNCTIPHTENNTLKHLKSLGITDTCSLLEYIRGTQLSDILGKYKLF